MRTNIDGDLKPGIGHKVFEYNRANYTLEQIVFKKQKDTWLVKLLHKWFGTVTPYKNSYFFTALNGKSAAKKMQERYNPPYVTVLEE